tara:strand:+ start:148 stop:516 length:369 start_codon:yes stop_codon:yes gene_type:complete
MDVLNTMASKFVNYITNFVNPYKHNTSESVENDGDIENQIEKFSKKGAVITGNVIVNLLILKVDMLLYLSSMVQTYFKTMLETTDNEHENILLEHINNEENSDDETPNENTTEFEIVDKKNQ